VAIITSVAFLPGPCPQRRLMPGAIPVVPGTDGNAARLQHPLSRPGMAGNYVRNRQIGGTGAREDV
jgi:hypothetical protein